MNAEAKTIQISFKYATIATVVNIAALSILAWLWSYLGFYAVNMISIHGDDFDKLEILNPGGIVRAYGFFFFIGITISLLNNISEIANEFKTVIKFIIIPLLFIYIPGIFYTAENRAYWGMSAMIAMLIYSGIPSQSLALKRFFYFIVSIHIAHNFLPDSIQWLSIVENLAKSIGTNPTYYFVIFPAAGTAALTYYLQVVLIRKMTDELTQA